MWKKLGRIFNPEEHKLTKNYVGFAKSPQPLVFDSFVRVYFSCIESDEKDKYTSRVFYADFDKLNFKLLKVSQNEVSELGGLGAFDEHGIFPFSVFNDDNRLLAYTTGWSRRHSVSVETAIGLVESKDNGNTFQKIANGPILNASINEPFLVCDGFVKKYGKQYKMWYIHGTKWLHNETSGVPERVYKISSATSSNAIDWTKDGKLLITDELGENECQALPTVAKHNGIYHMFFCYRDAFGFRDQKGKGYRMGYAISEDLETWDRLPTPQGLELSNEGWDSEMMCYPCVFECDQKLYLIYNGNSFGKSGFGLAVWEEE